MKAPCCMAAAHGQKCDCAERRLTDDETRAVLALMAEDAFDVLNWARRMGMLKDQQLEQVVEAFKKTLRDTETRIARVEK